MVLKEKMVNLKEKVMSVSSLNRNYEFDAELEDHPIPDSDIYRLSFADFHRFGEGYGMGPNNVSLLYWSGDTFTLPNNMAKEDAFKVLSYLTDYIEKEDDINIGSLKSVRTLDAVLGLERFGFRKVRCGDNALVVDLFTVAGRSLLFKRSEYYDRYFNWYTEGVSKEEVQEIYGKIGMKFEDIVWTDREKEKVKVKN